MENYFFDFDGTICESRHIYATCACTWGAFDPASLKKEKADYTVDYPLEILAIYKKEKSKNDRE